MRKILPSKVIYFVYQPKVVVGRTVKKYISNCLEEQNDNVKGICWQRSVTFFAMYTIGNLKFHLVVYKVDH